MHVLLYVVETDGETDCEPETAVEPDHQSLSHEAMFVPDHEIVDAPPEEIVDGFAETERVTCGVEHWATFTVVETTEELPPSPVH